MPVSTSDSRRRRKDNERDDRDPQRKDRSKHSASRSSRKTATSSPTDSTRERDRDRRPGTSSTSSTRKSSPVFPEMDRRPSATSGDAKISYPSFSRAHSKEFVGSRENVVNPRLSLYTPDATILESDVKIKREQTTSAGPTFGAMPPSPPLTAQDPDLRRSKSGHSMRTTPSTSKLEARVRPHSLDGCV